VVGVIDGVRMTKPRGETGLSLVLQASGITVTGTRAKIEINIKILLINNSFAVKNPQLQTLPKRYFKV
jgi:hypothetical protein